VRALYFTAPGKVEIREETVHRPGPGQFIAETLFTAISPGTEMLIYRGEAPQDMAADETISSLEGELRYPLKYGYANVAQIAGVGSPDLDGWSGHSIFSFQPHQTHFVASPAQVLPIPDGITPEQALFLPNMETAVNFVMDGQPLIGERVAVIGQGIVGLLTTTLLAKFPLKNLTTFDRFPLRRKASLEAGAHGTHPPRDARVPEDFQGHFDLTYELTGSPAALNEAISITGFDGRVIIGSWYGQKRASLDLGGYFHRSRIQLISSQVSSLSPMFSGRWDKARRYDVAWDMIRNVRPERWITQKFPFDRAKDAFRLLDLHPQETIQVELDYA
jgi:2-desacetyl-2-hydroxyethyl bacteriochlorophyllide A dehydrogenase